jgi:hypothetical protein
MEPVIVFPMQIAPEVAEFPRINTSEKIINIADWILRRRHISDDDNWPDRAA